MNSRIGSTKFFEWLRTLKDKNKTLIFIKIEAIARFSVNS